MSSINELSNSAFASAIKALSRSSQTAATAAAERADRVLVYERAAGHEINANGAVDVREMDAFARAAARTAQGLSPQEKRLGDAARILHQAIPGPGVPMQIDGRGPTAELPAQVAVAGLTGNVEVKNSLTGALVLSSDRRKLAQRIAGPGQQNLHPADFQAALQFLTMDER